MNNLGLHEADPLAWRSMGALLSVPLDARAALCRGSLRNRAPRVRPRLHVTAMGLGLGEPFTKTPSKRRRNCPTSGRGLAPTSLLQV